MTPHVFAHTKQGTPIAAWLLKCNPTKFDVMAHFRETGASRRWSLNKSYRNDLLAPGQPCYLWISGSSKETPAGIYGRGVIMGHAYEDVVQGGWLDEDAASRAEWFVDLEVRPLQHPILKADLVADGRFADAEVFGVPQLGNPNVLTGPEVEAIESFSQEIASWSISPYEAYESSVDDDDGAYLHIAAADKEWGIYDASEGQGFDIYRLHDDDEDYVGSYSKYTDAVRALVALTKTFTDNEPPVDQGDEDAWPIATFLPIDDAVFIFKYASDRYVEAWEAEDGWYEAREWPTLEEALVTIAEEDEEEAE